MPPNYIFYSNTTNTSTPDVDAQFEQRGSQDLMIPFVIVIVLYTIVFVIGLVGNVLILYVVVRNEAMRTVQNIFIANLAGADILLCLLAIPLTPVHVFAESWPFGRLLCHIFPMVLGLCIYVSTFSCMVIALHRYTVIIYPLKPQMSLRNCMFVTACLWLGSVGVTLPLGLFQTLEIDEYPVYANPERPEDNTTVYVVDILCRENWPSPLTSKAFTIGSLFCQFIVPSCVIVYCYTLISKTLESRTRSMCKKKALDDSLADEQRNVRINRMLVAMVVIFMIVWFPLNVFIITDVFANIHGRYPVIATFAFLACHWLAMTSTTYNVFLYGWMNENFKKEFRKLMAPISQCLKTDSTGIKSIGSKPAKAGVRENARSTNDISACIEQSITEHPPSRMENNNRGKVGEAENLISVNKNKEDATKPACTDVCNIPETELVRVSLNHDKDVNPNVKTTCLDATTTTTVTENQPLITQMTSSACV